MMTAVISQVDACPQRSVTVRETTSPALTSVLIAGDCESTRSPSVVQLSPKLMARAVMSPTKPEHVPLCAMRSMDPGQVIDGASESLLITSKEHDAVLPLESVAV